MRRSMPTSLLSRIIIDTPCNQDWNSMQGDERKRHCGSCNKYVHNLSEMSEAAALELLSSKRPVCVRLYRRPDGTVLTKECGTGLRRRWKGYAMVSAAACALLSLVGLKSVLAEEGPSPSPTPSEERDLRFILGRVKAPVETPKPEHPFVMGEIQAMPPEASGVPNPEGESAPEE